MDTFLETGNLDAVKDHWIFHKIVPGEYTFEVPKDISKTKLIELYRIIYGD